MGIDRVKEIEDKIASLKARWPAHSVPSAMWLELEELESELEKAKEAGKLPVNLGASPFDYLASDYDAWFDGEGKLTFAIEVQALQEVLPFLPKPWLEVGAGSGRFAQALSIENGLDPSIRMLEIARRRRIMAYLGRGEQLPFRDASFGTVFLITTLSFCDSPPDVLREVHRITVPRGKIALGTVLRESPWGRFYEQKKEKEHSRYEYSFFQYDEVVRLLEQAGFSVERVISTLFQKPGRVEHMESPHSGYFAEAGFTVIMSGKGTKEEPGYAN
jgi:ubiquinone/menaquinone biosynthesis C-methylase UbiE